MRSRSLIAFVTLAVAAVAASPAAASPGGVPSGPGPLARAAMYASVLDGAKVQILVRTCTRPQAQRRCAVIPDGLRAAIEAEVGGTVRWVFRAWPMGGRFFVLGPVYRAHDSAWYRYAWSRPTPGGCTGGGRASFRRGRNGWVDTGGVGYVGCPRPAS